jgi:hypothetical protein
VLLNCYVPAHGDDPARSIFKRQWHAALARRVAALTTAGRRVVVTGDLNVTPTELDHADPVRWRREHPGQRFADRWTARWFAAMLAAPPAGPGLVDAFRAFHPMRASCATFFSEMTGARNNLSGNRIDFFLCGGFAVAPTAAGAGSAGGGDARGGDAGGAASDDDAGTAAVQQQQHRLVASDIDQAFAGSDHVPISLDLECAASAFAGGVAMPHPAALNAMEEYRGKRQSRLMFRAALPLSAAAGAGAGAGADAGMGVGVGVGASPDSEPARAHQVCF